MTPVTIGARGLALAVAACGAGAACTTTSRPLLICHNANCAGDRAPDADDTLDALRGSLALRTPDGAVVFDGIELDSVWDRGLGRCTFAHVPDPHAPDFLEAAGLVVAHVAGAPAGAAHGPAFYVKIELKTDVGGGAAHRPDEIAGHVACVTGAARAVIDAGAASHNPVIPIFDSDDPALLAAVAASGFSADPAPAVLYETGWGAALPPGFTPQIVTLGWFDDPRPLTWDRSLEHLTTAEGGGLLIWARSPAPRDLAAMLAHEPAYLGVNNVEEARGLIDAL
ncbi:MAG TPA: hypothetical protein VFK02_02890 [Kofleriaceae bacterium]|nr:hypothetical protein [Kofleriaceae bacterium]